MAVKTWEQASAIINSQWQLKLVATYDDSITVASQNVTLQLWFRNVELNERRYQHHWTIDYSVDGGEPKSTGQILLPSSVNSYGFTTLTKNKYYAFGPAKTFSVKNDGNKHSFKVAFKCLGTSPRDGTISFTKTMPAYYIVPGIPTNLNAVFNEDTREITYTWKSGGNTAAYTLYRNYKDASGQYSVTGVLDREFDALTKTDTVPEGTVKVEWELVAHSLSNHTVASGARSLTIDDASKVWIKVDGAWVKATPYVKVNGEWKKVTKVYTKVKDAWERTTS